MNYKTASLIVLLSLTGCMVEDPQTTATNPVKSTQAWIKSNEQYNVEYQKWSTVEYDNHLYTVRNDSGNGAAIVHSPNCHCLKVNL